MDHAIEQLKNHMQATIELYQGLYTREQIEPEIRAYVKAINELEKFNFGETKTELEVILSFYNN